MLKDLLSEYVRACFTGLWIESHEHDDALAELASFASEKAGGWRPGTSSRGFASPAQNSMPISAARIPLAAIRALNALGTRQTAARAAGAGELPPVSELGRDRAGRWPRQIAAGKQNRTFLVSCSRPVVQIPTELEKLFVVSGARAAAPRAAGRDRPRHRHGGRRAARADQHSSRVLDAAAGLTRYEAEGAFSLSLVRQRDESGRAVWELKCQMLKKSGLLQLYRGTQDLRRPGRARSA